MSWLRHGAKMSEFSLETPGWLDPDGRFWIMEHPGSHMDRAESPAPNLRGWAATRPSPEEFRVQLLGASTFSDPQLDTLTSAILSDSTNMQFSVGNVFSVLNFTSNELRASGLPLQDFLAQKVEVKS